MKALLASLVGVVCAAGVAVMAQDPKLVEEGKKLYATYKCADCHTIGGKGGRLMKNSPLDAVGTKLSAADIKKWMTNTAEMEKTLEKPKKPAMSSKKYALKGPEVDALAAYMLTLTKK